MSTIELFGSPRRAFLFVVDGPDGRFSWFYLNSASVVDLNVPIAKFVLPVVRARAYLPAHWDGLRGALQAGVRQPYSDSALEEFLTNRERRAVAPIVPGDTVGTARLMAYAGLDPST